MADELSRLTGARSVPMLPGAPARPAEPLLPPPPAIDSLEPSIADGERPLDRSGLSALDLLLTSDLVVERTAVPTGALDVGLEAARGALLRRQPGEALAGLDAVWPAASQREEGWYLRAGALLLQGQSSESERVASDGLERVPTSVALRFLQSVARGLTGDLAGARTALQASLEVAPGHPVLVAQQVILQARAGRADDTAPVLDRLLRAFPDHPAARWAQDEVRAARAGLARAVSRVTAFRLWPSAAATREAPTAATPSVESAHTAPAGPDAGEAAFARLGARLTLSATSEAIGEARTLLRAFSAGGPLCGSVLPDQAHGARTVLAAIVSCLRNEPTTGNAALIRQIIPALRQGRAEELPRLVHREGRLLPHAQRRWVEALLREVAPVATTLSEASAPVVRVHASDEPPPEWPDAPRPTTPAATTAYATQVHETRPDGPLVPVRLGLGLLAEAPVVDSGGRGLSAVAPTPGDRELAALTSIGMGPGAGGLDDPLDLGTVLPPVLAFAVATAASTNGATGVVVVALGCMVWLATRRRTVALAPLERRSPGGPVIGRADGAVGID